MITFCTGKPGDGKSLFATRQILEDLIHTDAFIVTNIPLVPAKVHEYVSQRREGFCFDDRVKVIPDAEVYEFYRHRSGGLVLPWSPDKEGGQDGTKRLSRPEFTDVMKGNFMKIAAADKSCQLPVHYYIDEVHNFFSARDWATNGRGTLYYASQHRHLHDEIVLITQVMENVEKQLRGLASETAVVRNQLRRSVGPFRLRPVFRVKRYYGVPQGHLASPFSEETFELDPARVGACYKTTGALGVFSSPEEKKNRGRFPWWTLPVLGAAAVAALLIVLFVLPRYATQKMTDSVTIKQSASQSQSPQRSDSASMDPRRKVHSERESEDVQPSPDIPPARQQEVYYAGVMQRGRYLWVWLTDGRVIREDQLLAVGSQQVAFRDREGKVWIVSRQPYYPKPAPRQSSTAGSPDFPAAAVSGPTTPSTT